jgi:hypothetical protein
MFASSISNQNQSSSAEPATVSAAAAALKTIVEAFNEVFSSAVPSVLEKLNTPARIVPLVPSLTPSANFSAELNKNVPPPLPYTTIISAASYQTPFKLMGYTIRQKNVTEENVTACAQNRYQTDIAAAISALKEAVESAVQHSTSALPEAASVEVNAQSATGEPPAKRQHVSYQSLSTPEISLNVTFPSLAHFPDEFYVPAADAKLVTYRLHAKK